MTDITPLRHTVSFSRKVSPKQYESVEATAFVQFEGEFGEEIAANGTDALNSAKALVFATLAPYGVEVEVDETGEIVERTTAARSIAQQVTDVMTAFPGAEVTTVAAVEEAVESTKGKVGDTPPFDVKTSDPDEKRSNNTWAKARFQTHPSEFWDNRAKKTGRQPDYKHKSTGLGVWED